MSKLVILNQASLVFIGKSGLPDEIMIDLEERLRQADWNELLKTVLRGIPTRIQVVDTSGPERAGTNEPVRGKGRKRGIGRSTAPRNKP